MQDTRGNHQTSIAVEVTTAALTQATVGALATTGMTKANRIAHITRDAESTGNARTFNPTVNRRAPQRPETLDKKGLKSQNNNEPKQREQILQCRQN